MMRWMWKRWVWATLTAGVVAAGSAVLAQPGKSGPAGTKGDDTISIKVPGQPDQVVRIIKTNKKPDGSIETEVKDVKTGETFTLIEQAPDKDAGAPKPAGGAADKSATKDSAPRAKPRADDAPPADSGKERRLFGSSKSAPATPMPAASTGTNAAPTDMPPAEGGKRRGIISRIFGRKPGPAPANAMPAPGPTVSGSAKPSPPSNSMFPNPGSGGEPPRVMPSRPALTPPPPPLTGGPAKVDPVRPPVPSTPTQPPIQKSSPSASAPGLLPPMPTNPTTPGIPTPMPMPPATPVPTIPQPPGSGTPPGGIMPAKAVQPAGYAQPLAATMMDVQPHVRALNEAMAPSARLTAALALAQCRHASTDAVKAVLFRAAQADPCPLVRAACIDHLCKLGYYHRSFAEYLKAACNDPSEEVRTSAKAALGKMTPQQ